MRSPTGEPLFKTHCRICGGALIVNAKKRRTSLFNRRSQWDVEETCSSCGNQSGGTVSIVEFGSQGRTTRVLGAVRRLLSGIPLMNNRPEHGRDHGAANLARLAETAPFKVYGMQGNPLGSRLTGFGSGGKGQSIHHVELRYAIGRLRLGHVQGERLLAVEQGTADWRDEEPEALGSIRSLVGGGIDFHRDWNLRRIERTPRDEVTLRIDGVAVAVELTKWREPAQVILARMNVGGHFIRVTTLNVSEEELLHCLQTLVVLQEDLGALAQHLEDFDRSSRELQRLWEERGHC